MKTLLVLAVVLMAGCSCIEPKIPNGVYPYIGVGVGINNGPGQSSQLEDPIGVAGFEHDLQDGTVFFFEHHSSITKTEPDGGYNVMGLKQYFNK